MGFSYFFLSVLGLSSKFLYVSQSSAAAIKTQHFVTTADGVFEGLERRGLL